MNNIGIIPVQDGGITKYYNSTSHRGVDFGWINTRNCVIYAWQEGTVVQAEHSNTGGDRGEYCVIEHTYENTKRWSAYLHLQTNSLRVKVGDTVKMGEVIGNRGNTGLSNGDHLHLYLSSEVNKNIPYSYQTMKSNCNTDPLKWLYIDKELNTCLGQNLKDFPLLPEEIEYPQPVERDETKHQVDIHHKNKWLRLRNAPDGDIYDKWCTNGIYSVYAEEWKSGYLWYKIDTINEYEFWVAFSDVWATDYPVVDYKQLYEQAEEQLKTSIQTITLLQAENDLIKKNKNEIETKLDVANSKISEASNILNN